MFDVMQRKCMDWMVIVLKALPVAVFCLAVSLVGPPGPGFLFTPGSLDFQDSLGAAAHEGAIRNPKSTT